MIQSRPIFDRLSALADPTRSRLLAAARPARAHRGRAVRGAAAAAEHREPAPQDAGRRGLGPGARRGHEPTLRDAADGARSVGARSLAARARPGGRARRPPGRISCAPSACCRSGAPRRRRSSRRRAGQWDRVRAELYGARADLAPLAALLDPASIVGDLGLRHGADDGGARALRRARRSRSTSPSAMLAAARARVGHHDNVELRSGRLEALPIDDASLDVAVLSLVLHFVVDPAAVLRRGRARAPCRAAACSSSTWCRTSARSTARRWAISGSASRPSSSADGSTAPASRRHASSRSRPIRTRRAPRCSPRGPFECRESSDQ